jgi:hypothetical protein
LHFPPTVEAAVASVAGWIVFQVRILKRPLTDEVRSSSGFAVKVEPSIVAPSWL